MNVGRRTYWCYGLDRSDLHGSDIHRDGGLHNLDVHVKELNSMREVIVVWVILLMAVWAWSDTKKGGKP